MEITTSLPEGSIMLRDGRQLAYAEYGDPQGKPIFFFHGTPGSRLFHHPDVSIASSAEARIIAIDRPGFGRSHFKPGRTLLDWPNDVSQLADALRIDRFAVMGYSGGGPYAAVCASAIPDRLTAAGLVSSIAPLDNPQITRGMHGLGHTYFSLERHLPPLAKLGCWLLCTTWRYSPDLYFRAQLNGLRHSGEAQALLSTMKPMLTRDFQEAARAGTDGITWDLEILTRHWGFQLNTISTNVFLWHGENDTQAPLAMGKRLAAAIPHCRATFFPGEGHWAIYSHWQEILTALTQAESREHTQHPADTIVIASADADSGTAAVLPPDQSIIDIADASGDSIQGLQPAREVVATATSPSEEVPENPAVTEELPVAVTVEPLKEAPKAVSKKTARQSATAAEAIPAVASEPESAQDTPKPVSKKTTKRSAAATAAETPSDVTSEPAPAQEAPKPVSKKTAKRGPAVAETPVVTPEPEQVQETLKPVSKKTAKRNTATAVETVPAVNSEAEPVQETPKPVSKKTAKRSLAATATSGPPNEEVVEPKHLSEKAKVVAKKAAKPKAVATQPPPVVVPEESASSEDSSEPTPAKPSSRRKSAKEAVSV